jgi:AAA15 family ATPase/GTPase
MRSRHLRRDQLWFTEKDQSGATHLFSLSDIRTRKTDDIEKGYLEGRYGAIPFAGSLPDFLSD